MKKILYLTVIILFFSGCGKNEKPQDYLAKVNDEVLLLDEFKAAFSEDVWKSMSQTEKKDHLQEWVNLTGLAQLCDQEKITELPQIKQKLKNAVKKIKANTYIATKLNNIRITEEELFDYYQLHKREYLKNIEEYKYQKIVISDKNNFDKAVNDLKNNMSFKDAAIKYSEEAAGQSGGYMGFVSRFDVEEVIWNTLESLDQFRWKSVKIENKFYLLRWYEKREADLERTYSEIKDELRERLLNEKRDEQYQEIMKNIETGFDIEINYLFNGE
jgi:peptidyl-prolyl cis-trans isomerase C